MTRYRCQEDWDDAVDREFPFDRVCPSCGEVDPQMTEVDFGIGHYEYGGAPGFHTDVQIVTECCEATPVEYLGEQEEPDPDLIPEDLVAS